MSSGAKRRHPRLPPYWRSSPGLWHFVHRHRQTDAESRKVHSSSTCLAVLLPDARAGDRCSAAM